MKRNKKIMAAVRAAIDDPLTRIKMERIKSREDARSKINELYIIGLRLRLHNQIFMDERVGKELEALKEYLHGAYCLSYEEAKEKNAVNSYDSSIYFLNYGYQLGIRAERERRKEAKEKAAKRGNAGRPNETSNA